MFYFTNLLLDAGSRFQLSPLSGFKYNYIGFSVRDLHNYLLKECPEYVQLNTSLSQPFGVNFPDDEQGRNRYFETFWIDTSSPKNSFIKRRMNRLNIVLNSVIRTDGKGLQITYVDRNKSKTGKGNL